MPAAPFPIETQGERSAARLALAHWREKRLLDAAQAQSLWAGTEPTAHDWQAWLDRTLLALGAALLCAGVLMFFAYNWQDLHKFSKFALLALALSALAAYALWQPAGSPAGRAALGGAQIVTGVLLATIGQVYQAGADVWQLFAIWALLALPWALAARAAPHWWIVLVLCNVALARYCSLRLSGSVWLADLDLFELHWLTLWILLGAVALQLLLWFTLHAHARAWGFEGRTGPRILAMLACVYALAQGVRSITQSPLDGTGLLATLLVLAALGAWFQSRRAFDIIVLSLASLVGIVLIIGFAGQDARLSSSYFLLLALLTIGLSTGAALGLLRLHRLRTRRQP